jgi:hypothetical protein
LYINKNKWSFKFEESDKQGDPLNFELGYYDSEEENATQYTDSNGNSIKPWDKLDENATLYAKWELIDTVS